MGRFAVGWPVFLIFSTPQKKRETMNSNVFKFVASVIWKSYPTGTEDDAVFLRENLKDYDPNEEHNCGHCGKELGGRFLFCNENCEKYMYGHIEEISDLRSDLDLTREEFEEAHEDREKLRDENINWIAANDKLTELLEKSEKYLQSSLLMMVGYFQNEAVIGYPMY
jgi:hypothetical protein